MPDTAKPRFRLGERVYIQRSKNVPALYTEGDTYYDNKGRPRTVMVRAVATTCDFTHGYDERSRPVPGSERVAYQTSYGGELVNEDMLYGSVEEFEERNRDAIAEHAARRRAEAQQKRVKAYTDAKKVVTEFESAYFVAQAGEEHGG